MKASRSKKVIVKSVSPDTSFAEDGESTAIKEELKEFCENLDREAVVTDENVMPTKSQMQSPKRPLKTVPTVTPQKNEDGKLTKSFKKGAFGRLILVGSEEDKPKISATKVSPLVNIIYSQIRKSTGALGGNGATGAIYGELTQNSMQKILNYMIQNCELTHKSRFIDIGAGLGKPNLHAAQDPCCRVSLGVELETIRWQLSMKNLSDIAKSMSGDAGVQDLSLAPSQLKLHSGVNFLGMDIDDAETLNPLTHIYQYDLGFPPPLQQSIAKKFNTSCYALYFISYRPPDRVMGEYGYEVTPIGQFTTAMHGSGENHMVYFYKRTNPLCTPLPTAPKVIIPKRVGFDEEDEEVVCDPSFLSAIKLAVGPIEDLRFHAATTVAEYLNSERPSRVRRPRKIYE